MGLPPQLESDVNELRDQGHQISCVRNGNQIFVIFEKYSLPKGWNKKETNLLIIADISYPNSKLDMFWVDPDLLLEGGNVPQSGESIENYNDKSWRRFSWHVQKWNPAIDNLITYLGTINERLRLLQ
jgi:hypothetical protein